MQNLKSLNASKKRTREKGLHSSSQLNESLPCPLSPTNMLCSLANTAAKPCSHCTESLRAEGFHRQYTIMSIVSSDNSIIFNMKISTKQSRRLSKRGKIFHKHSGVIIICSSRTLAVDPFTPTLTAPRYLTCPLVRGICDDAVVTSRRCSQEPKCRSTGYATRRKREKATRKKVRVTTRTLTAPKCSQRKICNTAVPLVLCAIIIQSTQRYTGLPQD